MTPLVLVPGMMCDARLFAPQIAAFSKQRALHLPPINQYPSVAELAAALLAGAPPSFALAGLSMGGIVAMEVLAQAPERVERLALLDTNPCAELATVSEARAPQMQAVARGELSELMAQQFIPRYLAQGPHREEIAALCLDMAMALGPQCFITQSQALISRPDQQETLKAYKGPALVMCGAEDQLCPLARHELMHELLQNSELVVIEGAGHLSTLEQPKASTDAMARWLEA